MIDWQIQDRDGLPVSSHRLPYAPGDRLWVRETWRAAEPEFDGVAPRDIPTEPKPPILYEADGGVSYEGAGFGKLRPSIYMPRWASRITLEVTGVKVERLQSISEADAEAEGGRWFDRGPMHESGWRHATGPVEPTARQSFAAVWNTINGPGAWDQNPWVAAYTFKVFDTKGAGQ